MSNLEEQIEALKKKREELQDQLDIIDKALVGVDVLQQVLDGDFSELIKAKKPTTKTKRAPRKRQTKKDTEDKTKEKDPRFSSVSELLNDSKVKEAEKEDKQKKQHSNRTIREPKQQIEVTCSQCKEKETIYPYSGCKQFHICTNCNNK